MSAIFDLTCELIHRASVTPDDAGCQSVIAERLARAGFAIERLRYGEVDNLWATHGSNGPLFLLLGHTDVVPSGPAEAWASPPFEPTVRFCDLPDREDQEAAIHGRTLLLYGRGAADMKSGVAAMVVALEAFVHAYPDHLGTVALLLTSDEEGASIDGVRRVADALRRRGQRIDWCVVGEPSAHERLGDRIRVGRRGSLTGRLRVHGEQGHVAYPEKACNPIHAFAPALAALAAESWDEGNDAFPPTSFQISNLNAGTGADNVIPGELRAVFNFRFGTASTAASLRERVEKILCNHGIVLADGASQLDWWLSGEPFLTRDGVLREATLAAIAEHCGIAHPEASTGGGTSDGRFIAPFGAEIVELGPVNASIHKVDEHVSLDELERLPRLYRSIIERVLAG
jgi:succinyl-diaminopimelate desuccinylase